MKSRYFIRLFILAHLMLMQLSRAQLEVGIDEKLGSRLPLGLEFTDSDGRKIRLAELFGKSTLLLFVYYDCPGICNPLLSEVVNTVDKLEMIPGEDFRVITLSFDHTETFQTAKRWKENYLSSMKRNFDPSAWAFLTGDSISIKELTDSAGFFFKPDGEEFIHPGAVISVSPDGKISRYLFGMQFSAFDLKMALLDARSGKEVPTIARVLQFCFSYDPEGRRYTLNLTRIIGTVMLASAAVFFLVLTLKKKKKSK